MKQLHIKIKNILYIIIVRNVNIYIDLKKMDIIIGNIIIIE
jgi:hypothetical protein